MNQYNAFNLKKSLRQFLFGKVFGVVTGFIWILLLVRVLSKNEYGTYIALASLIELFITISNFGLNVIGDRMIPRMWSQSDRTVGNLIIRLVKYRLFFSCVFGVGLFFLIKNGMSGFNVKLDGFILIVYVFIAIVESLARFIETIFDSLLVQKFSQLSMLSRYVTRSIILISIYINIEAVSLNDWLVYEGCAYLFGFFVSSFLLWRTYTVLNLEANSSKEISNSYVLVELFHAFPIYISQLIGAFVSLDLVKLLVVKSAGNHTAAVFGFAASIALMLQRYLPSILLVGLIRPVIMASLSNSQNSFNRLNTITSLLLKVNLCIIGVGFVGASLNLKELMVFLSGNVEYSDNAYVLLIFLVYTLTQSARIIYSYIAIGTKQAKSMLAGQISGIFVIAIAFFFCSLHSVGSALFFYSSSVVVSDLLWIGITTLSIKRSIGFVPFIDLVGFFKLIIIFLVSAVGGYACLFMNLNLSLLPLLNMFFVFSSILFIFLILFVIFLPLSNDEKEVLCKILPSKSKAFISRGCDVTK